MSNLASLQLMYSRLKRDSEQRERDYQANGTIDWSTFARDQVINQRKVVEVNQADFQFGTLRVKAPCLIRLTSNVEFNPNAPRTWFDSLGYVIVGAWDSDNFAKAAGIDPNRSIDWFPSHSYKAGAGLPDGGVVPEWADNGTNYLSGDVKNAYRLGFFAAIAVEAEGVIIDLGGYTLRQHAMHALMQRFFATIELADQPFPPEQGPAIGEVFGKQLLPARQVTIKNGILDQSSHHCIHGNECRDVLIEDVEFRSHEVAAISLNGAQRVAIVNCFSSGSRQDVPVLGAFSAARFEQIAAQEVLANEQLSPIWSADTQGAKTGFTAALNRLTEAVNLAFNEIICKGFVTPSNLLFHNPRGLTDGPSYGILCSPPGVAVGPFMEDRAQAHLPEAADYYFRNVSMNQINIAPRDILSISGGNLEGNQVDMAGAILQLFGLEGQPGCLAEDGTYAGTLLSDMQVRLAQAKEMFSSDNPASKAFFGTLSIEQEIVEWALAGHDPQYRGRLGGKAPYMLAKVKNLPLLELRDNDGKDMRYSVKIRCNGDSMHHVHKGTLAFRFDGITGLLMEQCSAQQVTNQGPNGSLVNGAYRDGSDGGHEGQGSKLFGYTGADCYGIRLSACKSASLLGCSVRAVDSQNGSAVGLYISNESQDILLDHCEVNSVKAGSAVSGVVSWNEANTVPQAFGMKTDSDTRATVVKNCSVRGDFSQTDWAHEPRKVDLQGIDLRHVEIHGW